MDTYTNQWRKHWALAELPADTNACIDTLMGYRQQYRRWLAYHEAKGNAAHVADLEANLSNIREALVELLQRQDAQ